MQAHLISKKGSDRATGYNLSNKIIRHDGQLFISWLEAPEQEKGLVTAHMGVCDGKSGNLQKVFTLGQGTDNHCGPALALDYHGRMHTVIGGHHTPFLYRYSDNPADEASWSAPEAMGPCDTYPTLVADAQGTLHLLYRQGDYHGPEIPRTPDKPWQLWYRRKKAGQPWEAPLSMAVNPTTGYGHFMQSLSIGPGGALHLFFQFHYVDGDLPNHLRGRLGVYLRSDDGGDTWFNEGKRCQFPLTIDNSVPFQRCPEGGLRINNHVVDSQDRPWIFSCVSGKDHGTLDLRTDAGWEQVDLHGALDGLNMSGGHSRDAAITRSADGNIHIVIATNPDNQPGEWYDPRLELFHLVMDEAKAVRNFQQISKTDPTVANWLPAPENWDWARKDIVCADGPWLMFTHGLNRGGIGGKNINNQQTEVYLAHL